MPEWKLHTPENDRKSNLENARIEVAHPGKLQNGKFTTQKMPEWKFNTLENDRKITPQKKTEN